ncbi:MAG: hypothetical protein SFY95_01375 [Planctomycetota bacterium]|nr:hypothetical protein [Planctomycetota bacterium]
MKVYQVVIMTAGGETITRYYRAGDRRDIDARLRREGHISWNCYETQPGMLPTDAEVVELPSSQITSTIQASLIQRPVLTIALGVFLGIIAAYVAILVLSYIFMMLFGPVGILR